MVIINAKSGKTLLRLLTTVPILFLFYQISVSDSSDINSETADIDSINGEVRDSTSETDSPEDSSETVELPEELAWDIPTGELLMESYYSLDSAADARVVQKETRIEITGKINNRLLKSADKRRIKIYTERGLSYANYKHQYLEDVEFDSIVAFCYKPEGEITELSADEIYDETIVESKRSKYKIKAKSFSLPGVEVGSVMDVFVYTTKEKGYSPPVFRFHEEIPVTRARFRMDFPRKLEYLNIITNKPLIKADVYNVDTTFICEASDIIAIENEEYRLPIRNLVSELWTRPKPSRLDSDASMSWAEYFSFYRWVFDWILSDYGDSRKISKKIKKECETSDDYTVKAYEFVRDNWETGAYGYLFPSRLEKPLEEKEVRQADKCFMLCSIYKNFDIEAEIVWVNSDNCTYSPLPDFPSLHMFDQCLVYIPEQKLFLDPADRGAEFGILDEALSERFYCRPMAKFDILGVTPKIDEYSSVMVNLDLYLNDDNATTGSASIYLKNQAALEARRIFRCEGISSLKEFINEILFRDIEDAVADVSMSPDSLNSPSEFKVDCTVSTEYFDFENESDLKLELYRGRLSKT
ncbi:MAG: DUF3857 domain-containing protein [Candidatus Zixiibacteriota bacterium]|nr:MAG: DUF3857 domain-containing protein [candidate division Zixibacteria bacterium]